MSMKRRLALILVVLSVCMGPSGVRRVVAFSAGNHTEITKAALGFLKTAVLSDLIDNNHWVDNERASQNLWHFDGCSFAEGDANIRTWYAEAVRDLNPDQPRLGEASEAFGHILHPVQDLLAHSNWVDLGRRTLLAPRDGPWALANPYETIDRVVVLEGESSAVRVHRMGRIVTVTSAGGEQPGLITGSWIVEGSCPRSAAISHDDLNKDSDSSLNHPPARALATKQTRREWCRLLELVGASYGTRGVDFVLSQWAANQEESRAICEDVDGTFAIFVDGSAQDDDELGTASRPFRNLPDAVTTVPAGSTVRIASGTYRTRGVFSNPMTLQAINGAVIVGP